jgi:RNA 3'-terminal phosphate cyclase-like protein
MSQNRTTLKFEDGAVQFRQRLIVSILSHRPILIRNIRSESTDTVGLQVHEASFLKLLDEMTNGSRIEINNTGTQLRFVPGILLGGEIHHECPIAGSDGSLNDDLFSRSIGWYLEGIIPLAPFGKEPLRLKVSGITDGTCHLDPSVDYLKSTVLPLMSRFGIGDTTTSDNDILSPEAPFFRVVRRGAAPTGGGLMEFFCPNLRNYLTPIDWTDPGKFKRVRGTAISTKIVSSSQTARVAYAAKGVLHRLLPDVWIHTDAHTMKQHKCGISPSLSVILTAESTTGVIMTAERCLDLKKQRELPEDLGVRGAVALLEEIRRGGCIDTGMQCLALLWMCLTPEDVSRIRIGTLTPYTIESLRLFKKALGVEFKVQPDHDTKTVLLSCLGTGYRNMARAST